MTKKLTAITLATTVVIGSVCFSNVSYAEPNNDLKSIQDQRENIKEDLSEAEKKVANVLSELEELNKEYDKANQALLENEAQIENTEQKISDTIDEVEALQEEIRELEADIEKRSDLLKERMSSYQRAGGSISYLEVIFGAKSFGDLISRVSTVTKIAESDVSLMEQLEKDMNKVADNQELAFEKLDDLNKMKSEQEETLALISEQKVEIENSRETLDQKQRELNILVKELESKDTNLASLEAEAKRSIEAAKREEQARKAAEREKAKATTNQSNQGSSGKLVQTSKEEKSFTVTSTAYTIDSAGGSGVTATGINLRKNPNKKVIAVDPNVIPLGSVVYVEGYGYAIAGDTGSAIKGKKIDVFVSSQKEAIKWGVRRVKVTIQ
ncbi:hypothetical protein GMD78_19405 [Ornithinibacillus sp. L9]|uniref:Uncharacterized protein n=1 Tax=Ornithinibacillus caprae TaxID=2678566 RepID=A0A6N8FQD4_9BACI|nr:3D domain-containing protein [Ornithinibacillus caprae]MUK90527.1 hypothetical protein [Ornithinibacillus caprae]